MRKLIPFLIILFFTEKVFAIESYEKYWVQYSNENSLLFRYINSDLNIKCPPIKVDGQKMETIERENGYKSEFNIKVCQAVIDNNKEHEIHYKNTKITTKLKNIKRISILGDTGCKTEGIVGEDVLLEQNCNKLEEYPFSEIAKNIAKNDPDLIIHLGDYYYSSVKCVKDEDCAGRPFGDNLATWRADFIDNASQFFNTAPIIFIRGNHEACKDSTGGKGWSTMFDNSVNFTKCEDYSKPYKIELDKTRFLIMDSSKANDSKEKFDSAGDKAIKEVNKYIDQFNILASFIKNDKQNIFITHRPVLAKDLQPWISKDSYDVNYTLHSAIEKSNFKDTLKNVNLIISGHIHSGLLINLHLENNRMQQLISGNGGVMLDDPKLVNFNEKIFDYTIDNFFEYNKFGFNELKLENDAIKNINFYDYNGNLEKSITN